MIGENVDVNKLKANKEPYIIETPIMGLLVIKRPCYSDNRGSFQELCRIPDIKNIYPNVKILQSQVSVSKENVLRGIHAEPWDKIITPIIGRMSSVIVDLRSDSKTFKEWIRFDFENNFNNGLTTLFVPSGCGNSLCVFKNSEDTGSGDVIYHYTYSGIYDPALAGAGVFYKDTDLNINWPVKEPILSNRDINLPTLKEFIKLYR